MADKNKMSVDDILAVCRSNDGDGSDAAADAPAEPAAEASVKSSAPPAAAKPAGKPGEMSTADILAAARGAGGDGAEKAKPAQPATSSGKKPSEMSVEEMLAAARAGKAGGQPKEKPQAKPAAKAKPAATVAKPSKKAAAKADHEPRDTSSILAAARKAVKPGPMSKAEAAAKGKSIPKAKVAPPMPEKPAYAKPVPKQKVDDEDRRGFLAGLVDATVGSFLAVGFFSLAVVGALWTLGFAKFMFPNILTEPPSRFKVGFPGDFAPDTVTTKFKAQFGVWIVNAEYEGQRMVTALKSVCTHLGCTPNWLEGEQKFKCPCHGSGFYKDGINFEGPAPRPLERYAITVADDGQLEVDKSKTFQQEMGAWSDTASFVLV